MKCLHCQRTFHPDWTHHHIDRDESGDWCMKWVRCQQCKMLSFSLEIVDEQGEEQPVVSYPRGRFGTPIWEVLPKNLADDYIRRV